MSSPDVEAALEEVAQEIKRGAEPLELTQTVADEMKGRYRPDFEIHVPNGDYAHDRLKVLILARLVGNLATFLTYASATLPDAPVPTKVDSVCADWAGFIVSRVTCPPPGTVPSRGKHCGSYPVPASVHPDMAEMAAGVLCKLMKHMMPRITSGPLLQ